MRFQTIDADIIAIVDLIHTHSVQAGWWEPFPKAHARHRTMMMWAVGELCEAQNGWRKNLMDDRLPQYKMLHAELADCAIICFDMIGAYLKEEKDPDYFLRRAVQLFTKHEFDLSKFEGTVPEMLYEVIDTAFSQQYSDEEVFALLIGAFAVAEKLEIDLIPIIKAKHEYNMQRTDHKAEDKSKFVN